MNKENKFKDINEFEDIINLKSKDPERFEEFSKMASEHTRKSYMPKKAILKFRKVIYKSIDKVISSDISEAKKRAEILSILTTVLAIIFLKVPDEDTAIVIKQFLENKSGMERLFDSFIQK